MKPRVIISGSAGTGKSTLTAKLAERLDVPLIEEAMRRHILDGLDVHALGRGGHRELLHRHAADWIAHAGDCQSTGFVSDRCALDFCAFWLCNGYAVDEPEAYETLMTQATAAVKGVDLIVILPWGVFPIEPDGVRYPNPWHQFHQQVVLEGVYRAACSPCAPAVAGDAAGRVDTQGRPAGRLLFMPREVADVASRCRHIVAALDRLAGDP